MLPDRTVPLGCRAGYLYVTVTQAIVILKGGTSIEKIPPLDYESFS